MRMKYESSATVPSVKRVQQAEKKHKFDVTTTPKKIKRVTSSGCPSPSASAHALDNHDSQGPAKFEMESKIHELFIWQPDMDIGGATKPWQQPVKHSFQRLEYGVGEIRTFGSILVRFIHVPLISFAPK